MGGEGDGWRRMSKKRSLQSCPGSVVIIHWASVKSLGGVLGGNVIWSGDVREFMPGSHIS